MLKEFELTGKAAIVMGGGRVIGKGIALTLAEAGADVLAVARTESEVLQTAEEVQRLGVKGLGMRADATNAEEVNQVVEVALSHWGRIDILVNSAGGALVRKPLVPLPAASPPWAKDLQDFNTITTEDDNPVMHRQEWIQPVLHWIQERGLSCHLVLRCRESRFKFPRHACCTTGTGNRVEQQQDPHVTSPPWIYAPGSSPAGWGSTRARSMMMGSRGTSRRPSRVVVGTA